MNRVNDGPGPRELHALTHPVAAAAPARVHEPSIGAVGFHLLCKHFAVDLGVPDQKGRAKAGGERRFRFRHTDLGAGNLRCVAREELLHGLLGREAAHRRQHAEGVAGEEDDVRRVATHARFHGVGDVVDRVGRARVLGERVVGVVDLTVVFAVHDVFEHRAEANRSVDVGLLLFGQVDRLCVATAFDVEHALLTPAVLVVSDEEALRVGGQRRLARARKPEEDRNVFVVTEVGAAVHREDALFGHQVMHDREDALLHLSGVLSAKDDELALFEVDGNARVAVDTVYRFVGRLRARVENYVVGFTEGLEFFFGGAHEHVVHEQCVVRAGTNDADGQAITRVPTCPTVDHINALAALQVVDCEGAVFFKRIRGQGHIDVAPPDLVVAIRVVDDALVLGTAARLCKRVGDQCSVGGNEAAVIRETVFIQLCGREVAVDFLRRNPVLAEVDRLRHECLS